jgi:hypothetical protein
MSCCFETFQRERQTRPMSPMIGSCPPTGRTSFFSEIKESGSKYQSPKKNLGPPKWSWDLCMCTKSSFSVWFWEAAKACQTKIPGSHTVEGRDGFGSDTHGYEFGCHYLPHFISDTNTNIIEYEYKNGYFEFRFTFEYLLDLQHRVIMSINFICRWFYNSSNHVTSRD